MFEFIRSINCVAYFKHNLQNKVCLKNLIKIELMILFEIKKRLFVDTNTHTHTHTHTHTSIPKHIMSFTLQLIINWNQNSILAVCCSIGFSIIEAIYITVNSNLSVIASSLYTTWCFRVYRVREIDFASSSLSLLVAWGPCARRVRYYKRELAFARRGLSEDESKVD